MSVTTVCILSCSKVIKQRMTSDNHCRSDYRSASEGNVTVICLICSYTDSFTSIFDDMHTAYVKYHFYASLLVLSFYDATCDSGYYTYTNNLSIGEKVQIKHVTFCITSGGSRQQTQFR